MNEAPLYSPDEPLLVPPNAWVHWLTAVTPGLIVLMKALRAIIRNAHWPWH